MFWWVFIFSINVLFFFFLARLLPSNFLKGQNHCLHVNVSFFNSFSSSPWWLHCVPFMWNGISTGSLQESSLLYWEHWNRCCHKLDHEPYRRPRWNWKNTSYCNREIKNLSKNATALLTLCIVVWSAADFAAPLVLPGCSSGAGTTPTESVSEEHLGIIVSMGFSRDQATKALRATVRFNEVFNGCSWRVGLGQKITGENEAAEQMSRKNQNRDDS